MDYEKLTLVTIELYNKKWKVNVIKMCQNTWVLSDGNSFIDDM